MAKMKHSIPAKLYNPTLARWKKVQSVIMEEGKPNDIKIKIRGMYSTPEPRVFVGYSCGYCTYFRDIEYLGGRCSDCPAFKKKICHHSADLYPDFTFQVYHRWLYKPSSRIRIDTARKAVNKIVEFIESDVKEGKNDK